MEATAILGMIPGDKIVMYRPAGADPTPTDVGGIVSDVSNIQVFISNVPNIGSVIANVTDVGIGVADIPHVWISVTDIADVGIGVTNIPDVTYDPMKNVGGILNGKIKYDDILVIAYDKIIDLVEHGNKR